MLAPLVYASIKDSRRDYPSQSQAFGCLIRSSDQADDLMADQAK